MKSAQDSNGNTGNQPSDKNKKAGFLVSEVTRLTEENTSLKNRVAWFENQMFGQKSEKRIIENPSQIDLLGQGCPI